MAAAYKKEVEEIALNYKRDSASKGGKTAGNGRPKKPSSHEANSPHGYSERADQTRAKVGKRFGVGEKAVDAAAKIRKQGDTELVALVNAREVESRKTRRVKKSQELTSQGMSTRAIAEAQGVSQSTVIQDIDRSTEQGRSVEQGRSPERPEKVRGQDAKQYPAKALPPEEIDIRHEEVVAGPTRVRNSSARRRHGSTKSVVPSGVALWGIGYVFRTQLQAVRRPGVASPGDEKGMYTIHTLGHSMS
jgi:DNA-binding CsgD family transcriptional regulator